MKGYIVREFGGPEVMQFEELPVPEPEAGQVRVNMHASGINFAETRMRAGTFVGQPLPYICGQEGAGVIDAIGPDVSGFEVGQRIFGRARGCHAEQTVFEAAELMALPDSLNFVDGAAIPLGWLTAWHALHTVADIQPGSRVLIEAVGGSVSSAALQIAKRLDCWCAVTASTDEKLAKAEIYGADLGINYTNTSISEAVLAATDGQGVDVALMCIGATTAEELFNATGMDGKVVIFGSTGGTELSVSVYIGIRNLQLLSMSIHTSSRFFSETVPSFNENALPGFADGTYKPVVDTVLPLTEVVRAHEMIDEHKHFGKIILDTSGAAQE